MKTKKGVAQIALCCFLLCVMLTTASRTPALAGPASTRPPRSTPVPTAAAMPALPDTPGARIELRVRPVTAEWTLLWTAVEWQDAKGEWHAVEGWGGGLDETVASDGKKTWWVYPRDFGRGPFRWLVMDKPEGRVLAVSEPFVLPLVAGQIATVNVLLR